MSLESKLIIYGGGAVIAVGYYLIKKKFRAKSGALGDKSLSEGDPKQAIKHFQKQLISELELGKGSMNDDDPQMLLSDAMEIGMEIHNKLEQAYKLLEVNLDSTIYNGFVARIEKLIEDPNNFSFTKKLKRPAKKEFQAIRQEFAAYIKSGMPTLATD